MDNDMAMWLVLANGMLADDEAKVSKVLMQLHFLSWTLKLSWEEDA